jgi:hypothetical protein
MVQIGSQSLQKDLEFIIKILILDLGYLHYTSMPPCKLKNNYFVSLV